MKKLYSFSLLLSLLIVSCTPTATTESIQTEESVVVPESTPTESEALASPQTLTTTESTALPSEATAPLIDAPSIINIEMLDERDGWGVTEEEIVRTDDGGVTWYNVTPSGLTETGYNILTYFLNEKNAWLQIADNNNYPNGGTLYRTTDGGITWQSFETPFSAGDLEFIDEDNGWILADLGVGAGSMAVSVFQTNNGGATWKRVYTNDPNLEGASDTLPLGGIKVLLVPLDMQTAWIGGVVYAPGELYLFRTDDGGNTWTPVEIALPEEAQENQFGVESLRFISETQGVLVIRMSSDHQELFFYSTNDGGDTWQPFPETIPESGLLAIPSTKEIILYASGQFYITNNGGTTFTIVNPNVAFDENLRDISFVNASIGWAVVEGANQNILYKTEDGAQTWFPIIP